MALAWCFEDEDDPYAEDVLDRVEHGVRALVPSIWRYEIANGLIVALRRKRIDEAYGRQFISRLDELPIEETRVAYTPHRLFQVGVEFNLESYDAAYLELARETGLPLASGDMRLSRAARAARVKRFTGKSGRAP